MIIASNPFLALVITGAEIPEGYTALPPAVVVASREAAATRVSSLQREAVDAASAALRAALADACGDGRGASSDETAASSDGNSVLLHRRMRCLEAADPRCGVFATARAALWGALPLRPPTTGERAGLQPVSSSAAGSASSSAPASSRVDWRAFAAARAQLTAACAAEAAADAARRTVPRLRAVADAKAELERERAVFAAAVCVRRWWEVECVRREAVVAAAEAERALEQGREEAEQHLRRLEGEAAQWLAGAQGKQHG